MNIDQPSPAIQKYSQQGVAITWLHVRMFQHGDSRGALAVEFLPFARRSPSALWLQVFSVSALPFNPGTGTLQRDKAANDS